MTDIFPMHYIGEMEKQKKERKEVKTNYKHINALIHNALGHPLGLYNI